MQNIAIFFLMIITIGFSLRCDRPKPQRPLSAVTHPQWATNKTIYEVNIRQYTAEGTIKAFEKHLPRLRALGVGILWIMPVQPIGEKNRKGNLGSYYSIRDYTAIHKPYGTLQDFKDLVNRAHAMGMYVILDWVANHTAWDHHWVQEHPQWYSKDSTGALVLPNADWTDVVDLNYQNEALHQAMIEEMAFWVNQTDIDGFRCDVAEMVPIEFWEQARWELNQIKPLFWLAEGQATYLHEKAFDMTYDWKTFYAMNGIAAGKRTARAIDSILQEERRLYPETAYRMRFITNHDENSWNGTVFERLGDGVKPFAVLMATIPGKPLLYSGQEVGLQKRLRFFAKDTIEWQPNQYSDLYGKLFNLYQQSPALHKGSYEKMDTSADEAVYAYVRKYEQETIFVLLNLTDQRRHVTIDSPYLNQPYTEIFSGIPVRYEEEHTFDLEPWAYRLYVKEYQP
ncbi:MAG: alpha-amylase [Caldithrix sp.]|nr:alpha-amylase [Caldithrix sp.]